MKKTRMLFIGLIVALVLVAVPLLSAQAQDKLPAPIDPQSWKLQEDMLWEELMPNPVIDWMTELNPAGLANPKAAGNKDPINGALLLVDYWDRPFVTTQDLHTDLLGYYMFDKYGDYEKTVTKNPIIHVDLADYTQWVADYLNKNSDLNHHRSIDEYWREASYGKWAINLDSYGPYQLQGMEFEFSLNYTSNSDIPPTFRRSGSRSIVNESIALAYKNNVYLGDYDFFFILHAGYDESNVWYEFGQMQWASGADVPYEYGVRAKMDHIEQVLTAHPEYLLELEKPNVLSFSSTTPAINGYNGNTYLRDSIAAIKAGTFTEFKFPTADRTWANGYTGQGSASLTGGLGGPNTAPTRYVRWTSWIASTSSWSSSSSASVPRSPGNGGGSRSVSYSQQGESDAMGTFAHEFGHIVSHTDNYEATMWTQNVSPKTDYWDLMSRGDKVGPGGYHARWTIPGGQEAGSSPGHFMMFPKRRSGYYDAGDLLEVSVAQLKTRTPLVANVVSRNIPLNNAGYYPQLEEYGLKAPNYYKGIIVEFDSANPDASTLVTTGYSNTRYRAGWTGIEVVDRTGYDSFQSDHGVLLSRLVSGSLSSSQNRWVIDSHLYNIGLVDFYPAPTWAMQGNPTYYCIGHADQLNDALFHAGKSSVDTGYYKGDYTVNNNGTFSGSGTKHGSMRKGEPRNGRDIVSGDTVNEWYDAANRLHFYILEKNLTPAKYGEFLSYKVGVLRTDGVAVGGELDVALVDVEAEIPGRVAVASFEITNTGNATDIIRVGVNGVLDEYLLNDLYAIEAGETITVPVYFDLPANMAPQTMAGKDIVFTASSESNGAKVGVATVAAQDLVIYNYYVYLEAAKADYNIGQTLAVDVMLKGDKNYTQLNTAVTFDGSLFEYVGHANLGGLVAEVKAAANQITIRNVPSLNMLQGAPCANPVRIVTLKFKVKDSFTAETLNTKLAFAATAVTPTAGVTATLYPGKVLPLALHQTWIQDTPEQSIAKIKAINPNYIIDNQTQPTFNYSGTNNATTNTATIFEEVWIEVPCDTDEDGKRDLIRIQIARPAATGVIIDADTGETLVSVPVLMEHSPYRNNLSYSYLPNWPVVHDQLVNPSTAGYAYFQDVQSKKPRAPQWYWESEAAYWDYAAEKWATDEDGGNASWYVTPRAGVDEGAWFIPESRGAKDVVYQGKWPSTLQSVGATYQYYFTRGYAVVISASLGNAYQETESEGFTNCGDVEETLVCMAIIKWLNGECIGYTDRAATKEVKATWSNGNVAMTGQSYVGTLPQATACSGVDGIKAILPIAAISSWYDYYRGNGTVVAAYNFQGEDADELTDYCFGRRGTASFRAADSQVPKVGVAAVYAKFLAQMHIDQDRDSGDYNSFWDDRNYLTTIDSVPDDCGIMIMHGLNDWNVKTKQPDQFYRALKDSGKTVKEIWHLGAHATVWDKVDSHYMEYYHLWLDHFVYGLDNKAVERIPEINIPNPNNVNWEFYDKWPIAGSTDQRFYFGAPTETKAGGLLDAAPVAATLGTFKDDRVANAGVTPSNATQLTNWENRLFAPATLDTLSGERFAFATDPLTEPLRINGTVKVGLELSADKGWGSISAVLLEVGPNYRAFGTTATLKTLNSGFGTSAINQNNYTISATSSAYKIITRGYADVQNPNPARETYLNAPKAHGYIPAYYYQTQAVTPGEKYQYYFEFDPNDYTFKAGTRLAIFVYSTDYRTTIVPLNPTTFTLYAGANSFVDLPIVPTYSIFYNANGGTSLYDTLGGFSDTYPVAGQSAKAWEGGYRVVDAVGTTTVAKLTAPAGGTFTGWNTKADGTGITYQPGDRIPDAQMGNLTLFAQWSGIAAPAFEEIEEAVVLLEDDIDVIELIDE